MSAAGEREGGAEKKRPDARGDRITQDIQQQARQKESPVISELLLAAKKGHTEQVIKLLQQDPGKAVVTDKYGRTCLHLACIGGHITTALAILQSGALPIDSMTKRGHTSLHESCQEGHTHLSLLLISLGASLHSRSREGWTPLMCACSHGHQQLASILVAAGADINATTRLGLTPLHIAAWKGHTAVVQMLLSCGCNPTTVAHNNKTAQQLAGEEEHKEIVTILQAATAKMSLEPVYRISSLEGQLRLCQEKLAHAFMHHDQVLAAERHRRDERERKLQNDYTQQLEAEKTRCAALEAQVKEMKEEKGTLTATNTTVTTDGKAGDKKSGEPLQKQIVSGPIIKSASSSDLLETHNQLSSASRQPPILPTQPLSQHSERMSITDMVSECMRNPSSMANIRNHLKADNLTPKIQKKFRYKPSPSLPAVGNETSPLARDAARVGDFGSPKTSSQSCRAIMPNDK